MKVVAYKKWRRGGKEWVGNKIWVYFVYNSDFLTMCFTYLKLIQQGEVGGGVNPKNDYKKEQRIA